MRYRSHHRTLSFAFVQYNRLFFLIVPSGHMTEFCGATDLDKLFGIACFNLLVDTLLNTLLLNITHELGDPVVHLPFAIRAKIVGALECVHLEGERLRLESGMHGGNFVERNM